MKFVLLVEGATERASVASFLKRWLDPRLNQRVGIQAVTLNGYADPQKVAKRAQVHLGSPRHRDEIVGVICLLDLHGPTFFPPDIISVAQRIEWATREFQAAASLDKFRFFFAVHEFEAWLLSQPDIFPANIRDAIQKESDPEKISSPPPSKLLDQLFRTHTRSGYRKVVDGKRLFDKLDPNLAAEKCPNLKSMLDEMLRLAKDAGL